MHFVPFHKNKQWQRFFSGLFIGAFISFIVFIYMHGQLLEKRIEENLQLRMEKQELQLAKRTLEESVSDLSQKYQKELLIRSIEITIINGEVFKLDRFSLHELEEQIKNEASHIVGNEVKTFNNYYTLLINAIENKTFKINNFSYRAGVRHLFINELSEIHIELDIKR